MMKVTGYDSWELNLTQDTEVVGGNDPIIMPPEAERIIFGFKATGGNDDVPAVKEKLVESFTIPADTPAVKEFLAETFNVPSSDPGVAETLSENFIVPVGSPATSGYCDVNFGGTLLGTALLGDLGLDGVTGYYTSVVTDNPGGHATVPGTEAGPLTLDDSLTPASTVADLLAAVGMTLESGNARMTSMTAGVDSNVAFFTPTANGLFEAMTGFVGYSAPVDGVAEVAGVVPGNISVYFNSLSAVTVALDGTETTSSHVATKIAAKIESGYTLETAEGGSVLISCDSVGAHVVPLSIAFGSTGVTADSLIFTPGQDATGIVPGNISVFYNSSSATLVALTGLEATSADVADKIALAAPLGYSVETVGQAINIEKTAAGANATPLSISFGSTGVTEAIVELTPGADRIGDIVPGNISVFYNIAGASLVAIGRDDLATDITDKIVAAAPVTYTVANDEGAVSIEKKIAGANAIPLSISFGDTGVTMDARTFTAGADLIHGGGSAKATVIDLEYSIDTREKLNAGIAKWVKIETNGSASAYKEFVYNTHPVSAVRAKVTTAASDSTCNWIVKAV